MKLPSGKEAEVLALLSGSREHYGLELVRMAEGRLNRASIYVILGRMEDRGLVSGREVRQEGVAGLPRRLYRITGTGQRALAAWNAAQSAWGADFVTGGAS